MRIDQSSGRPLESSAREWSLLEAAMNTLRQREDGDIYVYYFHFHDNIVAELALLEPAEERTVRACVDMFVEYPAAEGGKNVLGWFPSSGNWIVVVVHEDGYEVCGRCYGDKECCQAVSAVV